MIDNLWFERSRVARLYSSLRSAKQLHAQAELMSDFGAFAINYTNECNVDKRNIATSSDGELFKYELLSANFDNENWANGTWTSLAVTRLVTVLGDIGTPDNPQKILAEPITALPDVINSPNRPDQDLYFINTADFGLMEAFLRQSPLVEDFAQLKYSVIEREELQNGSLNEFFDLAVPGHHEMMLSTMSYARGIMDSIKVGGRIAIYVVSDYTNMYRDSLRSHENDFSMINRYMADREDFDVVHVPIEFGWLIGKRVSAG